jgi:predicted permease
MPFPAKFITIVGLIAVAMGAGYLARRTGLLREGAAKIIMTLVAVLGYPPIGFLSIWSIRLRASDALLPAAGAVHAALMMLIGMGIGRLLTADRAERGLFAVASGVANHGTTLGGFVLFLLFGEAGLARSSIYVLMFWPVTVFLAYPVARHHAGDGRRMPLGRLYRKSVFDIRSIGLLTYAIAIVLSATGVPRPALIGRYHIVDVLVFLLVPVAYFGIGLRLHASHVRPAWRLIAALAGVRFGVGLAVGSLLLAATRLTPWPLEGLSRNVFLVQAFVPTAVMVVAMGNMFNLRPRTASVLFVANTLTYLALVLPWVLWALGG